MRKFSRKSPAKERNLTGLPDFATGETSSAHAKRKARPVAEFSARNLPDVMRRGNRGTCSRMKTRKIDRPMKHALLPAALLIAAGVLCTNCKTKMKISTLPYPGRPHGQHGRRLLRNESARSVPLAGGRQLGRDGRLGDGRKRSHAELPVANPVPRQDPQPVDRALELSEIRRAEQARRLLFLFRERRTAKPERALPPKKPRRSGPRYSSTRTSCRTTVRSR